MRVRQAVTAESRIKGKRKNLVSVTGISVALQAEGELFLSLPEVFSVEVTGLIYTHRAA